MYNTIQYIHVLPLGQTKAYHGGASMRTARGRLPTRSIVHGVYWNLAKQHSTHVQSLFVWKVMYDFDWICLQMLSTALIWSNDLFPIFWETLEQFTTRYSPWATDRTELNCHLYNTVGSFIVHYAHKFQYYSPQIKTDLRHCLNLLIKGHCLLIK